MSSRQQLFLCGILVLGGVMSAGSAETGGQANRQGQFRIAGAVVNKQDGGLSIGFASFFGM